MTTKNTEPRHGEVWLLRFEPQVGREIKKTRPAVILSSNEMDAIPLRTVVPVREYKPLHRGRPFLIHVEPSHENGLSKASSIDVAQIHTFDLTRFVRKIGEVSGHDLERLKGACIAILDLH